MPWSAVAGAVVGSVANKALNSDKNGGAGASTNTKDPWAAAAPWLTANLGSGQTLQNQYANQPFSAAQQQAYDNSYAQSDYMRGLVPGLLSQMQNAPAGFDRNNPQAKQTNWDWGATPGLLSSGGATLGGGGSLGSGGGSMSAATAKDAAAAAAAKAAAANKQAPSWSWDGQFHQQDDVLNGTNFVDRGTTGSAPIQGAGGFGSFRYGQDAPQPGTTAYRDMTEYFLRGGVDTNNLYGKGTNDTFTRVSPTFN